jgi:hypothetical protein
VFIFLVRYDVRNMHSMYCLSLVCFFHQQDMIGVNEYDIYGQGLSTVYSGVGSPKHSASGTLLNIKTIA